MCRAVPRPQSAPVRHSEFGKTPAYLKAYKKQWNEDAMAVKMGRRREDKEARRTVERKEQKRAHMESILKERILAVRDEYGKVQHATDLETAKTVMRKESLEGRTVDKL